MSTEDQIATIQAMPTSDPRNFDDSPDWSPDGKFIVFGSGRSGNNDLWVIAANGAGLRNLTIDNPTNDYNPQWSPDGRYILFVSDRDEKYDLWRMDADGTNPIRLRTTVDQIGFDYQWSPDSQRIVFVGVQNEREDVWVINVDGSGAINLTANTEYGYLRPGWSPDSTTIAAISSTISPYQSGIVVINVDDKRQVEVIEPTENRVILFAMYSPVGDQIAFSQNIITPSSFSDVWTIGADSSLESNITNTDDEIENGAWWSPDGNYILFTCNLPESNELCRVDADGSNRLRLTNDGRTGVVSGNVSPSWSPDGQHIAYVKAMDTGSAIWLMDSDGSNKVNLIG